MKGQLTPAQEQALRDKEIEDENRCETEKELLADKIKGEKRIGKKVMQAIEGSKKKKKKTTKTSLPPPPTGLEDVEDDTGVPQGPLESSIVAPLSPHSTQKKRKDPQAGSESQPKPKKAKGGSGTIPALEVSRPQETGSGNQLASSHPTSKEVSTPRGSKKKCSPSSFRNGDRVARRNIVQGLIDWCPDEEYGQLDDLAPGPARRQTLAMGTQICADIMGMVHRLCKDTVKVESEPERLKKAQVDLELSNGKVEELKRRVTELESEKSRHLKEMELEKARISELKTKLSASEERNNQLHQRVEDGSKRIDKLKVQVQELEKRGSYSDGENAGYRTCHRRLLTILPRFLPKVNWDKSRLKSLDDFMEWVATCEWIRATVSEDDADEEDAEGTGDECKLDDNQGNEIITVEDLEEAAGKEEGELGGGDSPDASPLRPYYF